VIKHWVAFRFKDDVSDEVVAAVVAETETFPSIYPQMRNFTSGRNISSRDTKFTHAFTIEFDNQDDLLSYLQSDSHETFVKERWRPVIDRQAIVSYEY
jgi:hypothetical protein